MRLYGPRKDLLWLAIEIPDNNASTGLALMSLICTSISYPIGGCSLSRFANWVGEALAPLARFHGMRL